MSVEYKKEALALLAKHPAPWSLTNRAAGRDISERVITMVDANGKAADFHNIEVFRGLVYIVNDAEV